MKLPKSIKFLLILLCLFPLHANALSIENNSQTLMLHIDDAYYGVADNDDYNDDVFIIFTLFLEKNSRSQFEADFILTLPSGRTVTYGYFINTALDNLQGEMIFHNDALESGMYNIKIDIRLLSGGTTTGSISHDFDPPGENSGGTPHGSLTF